MVDSILFLAYKIILMKEIVCGVMLCRNSPILQSPKCSLHYCSERVKTHFHPSPEDE